MHVDVNMDTTIVVPLVSRHFRGEFHQTNCVSIAAEFPYAGQNIARRGNTRDYEKVPEAVERMTNAWFGEYVDADMSYIDAYRHHDEG